MDNRSSFLAPADTLEQLKQQYEGAREAYERTHTFADWTIVCEAQGRYLDAKRAEES